MKGFDRVVDRRILMTVLSVEDLESMICGQRKLDFKDLQEVCRYGNGFTPQHKLIAWFWEIVLQEWDDDKRRRLLVFATGTDRAPVNGLRSMKFAILKDNENQQGDSKLPTSHTCFNQMLLPDYAHKDTLRDRLEVAIDNSTGFGMV